MPKPPRISEAEWLVMKVIWKERRCTAQQVMDSLSPVSDWGPATVKTLLNRLLRKGALHFEKQGKTYFYSPAFPEAVFRTTEADSFLQRVFEGGLSPMLSHFVQSRRLSRKQLDELEQIVRDQRRGK